MCTAIDRSLPAPQIGHEAAPEQDLSLIIFSLEFNPDIKRVHRPTGEEVPDILGSDNHIDSNRLSPLDLWRHPVNRGDHGPRFRVAGSSAHCETHLIAFGKATGDLQAFQAGRPVGFVDLLGRGLAQGKYVDRNLIVLKKLDNGPQLFLVLVGYGKCRVCPRKAMTMHLSVDVCLVLRGHQGHMAIDAFHRFWRIIETSRSLSRNATGLPGVILVKAPEPAIVVHRNIEVNLVAARAVLGGLGPNKGLHERLLVRSRIQVDHEIVHGLKEQVVADSHIVQGRIFDDEIAVSHAAVHRDNGVTRRAGQPHVRFGTIQNFPGRGIHHPV